MPNDALHYHLLTKELKTILTGAKINKIISPNNTDIVLLLRANNSNCQLLLSCNANNSRIQLLSTKHEHNNTSNTFCTHLRRHLTNSTINSITSTQFERIINIHCTTTNELGDRYNKLLICELMGRRSNMMLVNLPQGTISDCLYKASIDVSPNRPLLPGLGYHTPPSSPMRDSIQSQFEQYQDLMLNPCVRIRNDWCVDFWASPQLIHNQIDDCTFKHFDTLHQAINYYYDSILAQQDYNNLHTRISTALSNAIKKSTKKQSQLLNQQAQGQDYDKYKLYGELLLTYIYMVKYGDSQIDVYDYNNENQVTIQLNTTKNPSQNVADYFKKYNKKRKSVEMSITQLQQVNADLAYYQSLQETLATSTNKDDLDNLYQELVSCKLIDEVTKSKSNVTTSQPRMFEIDGFKVQIGKNNIQNDQLYRKAASTDIWLHAQKIHGCHAIISTRQKSPNLSTITKVAGLVAWFSKPKNVDKILVDYTTIKNVSKPRGSKPGMVSYVNQKTLWVTPDNSPIKDT